MTDVTAKRPMGVTFVAALTWIVAFFDVVVGSALLLISTNQSLIDQIDAPKADVRLYGIAVIIIGVLTALVAIGLTRGSNTSRVLVLVLMVVRVATAVYGVWAVKNFTVWTALVEVVLALAIIVMLTTKRASDYFRGR